MHADRVQYSLVGYQLIPRMHVPTIKILTYSYHTYVLLKLLIRGGTRVVSSGRPKWASVLAVTYCKAQKRMRSSLSYYSLRIVMTTGTGGTSSLSWLYPEYKRHPIIRKRPIIPTESRYLPAFQGRTLTLAHPDEPHIHAKIWEIRRNSGYTNRTKSRKCGSSKPTPTHTCSSRPVYETYTCKNLGDSEKLRFYEPD